MTGNPKDRIGLAKIPLHLFPASAVALGSIGILNGALKYGRNNFRAEPVRASIYVDAAFRHLHAWFEGEEADPDDGVPHLGAVLANLAILVDAQVQQTLVDDRNFGNFAQYREFFEALTPHVLRLNRQHVGRSPTHFTREKGHTAAQIRASDDLDALLGSQV